MQDTITPTGDIPSRTSNVKTLPEQPSPTCNSLRNDAPYPAGCIVEVLEYISEVHVVVYTLPCLEKRPLGTCPDASVATRRDRERTARQSSLSCSLLAWSVILPPFYGVQRDDASDTPRWLTGWRLGQSTHDQFCLLWPVIGMPH